MNDLFRFLLILAAGWAVTWTGCRDRGAGGSPSEEEPGPAKSTAAAPNDPPPTNPVVLSDDQVQAVDRITAAGGEIEKDADGYVAGIDLATRRVVADDELVRAVLAFPRLRRLQLAVSAVAPETLDQLATLTDLTELMLQDAPLDDAALARILKAEPLLRRLTLRRVNRVTDAGLAALSACPELEVVALIEMSGITGEAVAALRRIERLRSLDVRNCGQLTTADFTQLASLSALLELKVGGPAVNDQVVAILAAHPALTSLAVEDAQVSAAGLHTLADASQFAQRLQSLAFARCSGITDESLQVLGAFRTLETLSLREIMLNGSFLQYLNDGLDVPMKLKSLTITNALLTDDSLAALPALCPTLVRLDVSGNPRVTDAVLETLRQLPVLREVKLDETSVTKKWFPSE